MSFDSEKNIIHVENLVFEYSQPDGESVNRVIDGLDLDIERGSFVCILGRNGSGKSTLAKCFNGLLIPAEGKVYADGFDTSDDSHIWDVRQNAGMVFQNPDNQFVSTIVEDDVAFGPENLGIDPKEIRIRVDKALDGVNMGAYKKKSPRMLSGGQKQRIAIAGVVAMKPKCIIFDEPTAMLDPQGRIEIMEIIRELHSEGITVILITHFMEEAACADRILVMDKGRIVLDGTPDSVFRRADVLRAANLDIPFAVELADKLRERGLDIPEDVITDEQLMEVLCQYR